MPKATKNLLLNDEATRSSGTSQTNLERLNIQLSSYSAVPILKSDDEGSDSDLDFCLIQVPGNLSLEDLNDVEVPFLDKSKTFETSEHCCTFIKGQSPAISSSTLLKPLSYDKTENKGTVSSISVNNLLIVSNKLQPNTETESFYIPTVKPPTLPTNIKNRNFAVGCSAPLAIVTNEESLVKKRKHSKKKKSKKLKFDEENETCLIECTENMNSADTNQHKRFKKKKRKKESKH